MSSAPAGRDATGANVDAVLTASRLLMPVSARSIAAVDDTITIPQFRLLVMLHARGPAEILRVLHGYRQAHPHTWRRIAGLLGFPPEPTDPRWIGGAAAVHAIGFPRSWRSSLAGRGL